MKGGGKLRGEEGGEYYKTWANYFVRYFKIATGIVTFPTGLLVYVYASRFFEEYHRNGIDFWGTTIQNEPTSGLNPDYGWQTMYLSAAMERYIISYSSACSPRAYSDPSMCFAQDVNHSFVDF